jgi:hypothetical protein
MKFAFSSHHPIATILAKSGFEIKQNLAIGECDKFAFRLEFGMDNY